MTLPALGMESASLSFELKAEAEGSIGKGGISRLAPWKLAPPLQCLPPILHKPTSLLDRPRESNSRNAS
ncbi:hypothetical protein A2757_02030 [Candidatus Giovannonibacteria bacterium RIFCSPHIGHO2_01_FULL_48_47]|nr:MAG: hypothetical protein A2757_02030 [Candidatus Giovannonibacteria bacterium RIFCSPHIGHO2_01_FULL_48_47]OGF67927.1 MAG: hypothetical protein A3D61_02430 [Candidatus Giovannonibacteria bacterium RIFCSPHIGHO2_02_FULL_48_15]OGF88890.1 MAG: hypothetical protein A3B26_01240 [Candidatus Giovannonibacteria bacterium RIFCSPLOWO2_01_FULL_48_47]OGF95249.1 MAG: hypothetical protein A2433_01485 [Candidatus Giovannonibacteria bacterium RIFOXYC1_FULL_48_8]OGF96053.1 MAG: hypothetical protein A2613_00575